MVCLGSKLILADKKDTSAALTACISEPATQSLH